MIAVDFVMIIRCAIRIPAESVGVCMETISSSNQITSNTPSFSKTHGEKRDTHTHTNLN